MSNFPYDLIKEFYGDKCAKRSGIPLINHVDEGLEILDNLGADTTTRGAFCLHPIIQTDEDFEKNFWWLYLVTAEEDALAFIYAVEYRRAANAYLCNKFTDHYGQEEIAHFVGKLMPEIRLMLIADKLQNQKDFRKYHYGTHARSEQLEKYFINWLNYLDYKAT